MFIPVYFQVLKVKTAKACPGIPVPILPHIRKICSITVAIKSAANPYKPSTGRLVPGHLRRRGTVRVRLGYLSDMEKSGCGWEVFFNGG